MASHLGILSALRALRERLAIRMAVRLGGNPQVEILGSQTLAGKPQANTDTLGLYLHRISVDPFSRNRHLPPQPGRHLPRPELPVNLHVLLVAWCTHTEQEIEYLAAAIQIIGAGLVLESADMSLADPDWGSEDVVQVLPEEVFAAKRIPGSKQACVYEVAFLDQIAALTTDKARAIIVYGAGSGSLDAQVAAQKLAVAGFTNVTAFEGGLDAWGAAGLPPTRRKPLAPAMCSTAGLMLWHSTRCARSRGASSTTWANRVRPQPRRRQAGATLRPKSTSPSRTAMCASATTLPPASVRPWTWSRAKSMRAT